jgi:hypothetical protein
MPQQNREVEHRLWPVQQVNLDLDCHLQLVHDDAQGSRRDT